MGRGFSQFSPLLIEKKGLIIYKGMDSTIFSAMQTGKPYKSYKKTIPAKVYVTVLNSFDQRPEGLILEGRDGEDGSYVDVWSEMEDSFFKRMNKRHLESGTVVSFEKQPGFGEVKPEYLADASEEQLKELLGEKFLKFSSELNKVTSESVLIRLLTIARELEKSEKIINKVQARLSEIQTADEEMELDK